METTKSEMEGVPPSAEDETKRKDDADQRSDEEDDFTAQEKAKESLLRDWTDGFWCLDAQDSVPESPEEEDKEEEDDNDEPDLGLRRKSTKKRTENQRKWEGRPVIVRVDEVGETAVDQKDRFSGDTGFSRGEDIAIALPSVSQRSSAVSLEDDVVKRPKYYYVAREILTSERTYFKGLLLVEKAFHGAIKTYNLLSKMIVPEPVLRLIFSNAGELYEMHKELMVALETRLNNWDENPRIGDILKERAPYFKMYSTYSIAFESAQTTLAHWIKKSPELADIVKKVESTPPCKSMAITSFMLTPIQRIPRYKLLLQNYIKHLDPESSDRIDSEDALKVVSDAALHMDQQCKKLDNFQKVIQIQRTFVGNETIVAPGREFVAKGPVVYIDGKHKISSILFLFSDILVVARSTRHGQYRVQFKIQVSEMKVQDRKTEVLPNGFSITEQKLFVFGAKEAEEKDKWLEVFEEAIKRSVEKRSSLTGVSSYPTNTLSTLLRRKKIKAELEPEPGSPEPQSEEEKEIKRSETDEVDTKRYRFLYDTEIGLDAYCQMSGYLKQKSTVYQLWRRRWFEVSGLQLFSFHRHNDEDPVGFQPLSGCTISTAKEPLCFLLTTRGGKICVMQADSDHDLKKWVSVLTIASVAIE